MAATDLTESITHLQLCPYCKGEYDDPVLLSCGHQLCKTCAVGVTQEKGDVTSAVGVTQEKVDVTSAVGVTQEKGDVTRAVGVTQEKGDVTCAVCEAVTSGTSADRLPMSLFHEDILWEIFSPGNHGDVEKYRCLKCKTQKVTKHCRNCSSDLSDLCDSCHQQHEMLPRFSGHVTAAFDPLLLCCDHPQRKVSSFCVQCDVTVCDECLFEFHARHDVITLQEATVRSRKHVRKFLRTQKQTVINQAILHKFTEVREKAADVRRRVEEMMVTWDVIEDKLDAAVEKMEEELEREAGRMEQERETLTRVCYTQEQVIKFADLLQGGGFTDTQVIRASQILPTPDTGTERIQLSLPAMPAHMEDLAQALDHFAKSDFSVPVNTAEVKVTRGKYPVKLNPRDRKVIKLEHKPRGVRFVAERKVLLVRVEHDRKPIVICAFDGDNNVTQRHVAVDDVTSSGVHTQIDYDSSRDLILLPCADGKLVRVTLDGKVKDTSPVLLNKPLGQVAHINSTDMYVAFDLEAGDLLLICPSTLNVKHVLNRSRTHSCPLHLCIDTTHQEILASDWGKNLVYIYNVEGQLVTSLKADVTDRVGTLSGLLVDATGHVIIADFGNEQIFRVKMERRMDEVNVSSKDGQNVGKKERRKVKRHCEWECILDKHALQGRPYDVDIDHESRVLAVSLPDTYNVQLFTF